MKKLKFTLFAILLYSALVTLGTATANDKPYDSDKMDAKFLPVYALNEHPDLDNPPFSTWYPINSFPNLPAATYYNACAWLGDTLYMQAPTTTGAGATTIYRYTWGGTWTTGRPLPGAKTGGSLIACNNKLYFVGGGSTVTTGTSTTYEYDPVSGWSTAANIPTPVTGAAAVCWGDSVIFVVSGGWSSYLTTVQFYRPASDTWGTSSPIPAGRRSHAGGIWGNKIFIACGWNGSFMNSFYIGTIGSNASSITWAAGPVYPGEGKSRIGGWAGYNRFFAVGGNMQSAPNVSDSTFVYNVLTNTWSAVSGKPHACSNMWAAVGGKIIGNTDTLRVFQPGGYGGSAGGNWLDVMNSDTIITIVGITNNSGLPERYSLKQNYPNPFNPSTIIDYSIAKAGHVKLYVYDVLGRELNILVNEYKNPGEYSSTFEAGNLSSGVYFYRLVTDDFTQTKKMLLVK